jgi:hypothetical protein
MIEINLIPDVKQEYLKTQSLRAKVTSVSILISLAALGAIAFLAAYMGTQAVREAIVDKSVQDEYSKLVKDNPDLDNIVTIQNQLANISSLNDNKQITSRILEVLSAINPEAPNDVKMTSVNLDPTKQMLSIEATAKNGFQAADIFKKTILNTNVTYTADSKDVTVPLTDTVDLGEVSFGTDAAGAKVLRFKLSFEYAGKLLSNQVESVKIVTPTGKIDVTDSKIYVPDSLFSQAATDLKEGN